MEIQIEDETVQVLCTACLHSSTPRCTADRTTVGDGHRSTFTQRFLHRKYHSKTRRWRTGSRKFHHWRAQDMHEVAPTTRYSDVKDGEGLSDLLAKIVALKLACCSNNS